jgi:hypothetical protein
MADFYTRVELHGGFLEEYEQLDQEMELRGFSRTVKGGDGKAYYLPSGMYHISGDLKTSMALDLAQAAALLTGKPSAIMTIESAHWMGHLDRS